MKIMTNRQLKEMEDRVRNEVNEALYRRQKIDDMERTIYRDMNDLRLRIIRLEEKTNTTNVDCKVDPSVTLRG